MQINPQFILKGDVLQSKCVVLLDYIKCSKYVCHVKNSVVDLQRSPLFSNDIYLEILEVLNQIV